MIIVYTGPMYASKSYYLIKASGRFKEDDIICFKPVKDTRDGDYIRSRDCEKKLKAYTISKIEDIHKYISENHKAIFIDEAQFLKGDASILLELSIKGIYIYIAGLNLTSEQKPFGIMPQIMCMADFIQILKAQCNDCDNYNATYTYSLTKKQSEILIDDNNYITLCPKCLFKRLNEYYF